jgi:hypothetical protein
MARPLKVNDTIPKSIKEMSDGEIDYLSYVILTDFASSNTGVGTLNMSGTGTSIGTLTDTIRPDAVGTHPVGTSVTSTTTTVYQDLSAVTITGTTRPLKAESGTPYSLKEMTDSEINAEIVSQTAAQLASGDIGSYRLATSTPAGGGTWEDTGMEWIDTSQSENIEYKLWRKTNGTVPTTVRSLKTESGTPYSLKEMSDVEIQTLTQYLRKYIVDNGIGQYKVQAGTPTPGTWVSVSTITDTRQQVTDVNYTGEADFSDTFTGNFTTDFVGNFTDDYTRTSTRTSVVGYTGDFATTYVGDYVGNFLLYYSEGTPSLNRTSTRTSIRNSVVITSTRSSIGNFAGDFLGNYIGNYTTTFTGNFTSDFVGNYIGPADYAGLTVSASKETNQTYELWIRTA